MLGTLREGVLGASPKMSMLHLHSGEELAGSGFVAVGLAVGTRHKGDDECELHHGRALWRYRARQALMPRMATAGLRSELRQATRTKGTPSGGPGLMQWQLSCAPVF